MTKLREIIAIITCKLVVILSRMLGNQGTDFPGRLARKIYPDILRKLSDNVTKDIYIITGTNGKTTTTNMIAEIIRETGCSYIHNRAGANMITGITTAFVKQSSITGRRKFDYAILETDEANVPLLLNELTPRFILITNFFRDQLDRYGELDHTINMIKVSVRDTDIELILNADDPLVSHFQNETGLHCWYYGFADTSYDSFTGSESREGRYCVFCGHELDYERYHYAQLGKYHCPACNNKNPERNFTGDELQMTPNISLRVNNISVKSPYQGFYNAYNILAAVSMTKLIGISDDAIRKAIARYQPRAGRMETFIINGKKTILILVKNPTGLNQTLAMLSQDAALKNVFIALNDNAADGRDISWIWDADVELIAGQEANIKQVVCSGQRSGDMAVRVKYSGVDASRIIIVSELKEGIAQAISIPSELSYILCTYTALFASRKILARMQKQQTIAPKEESSGARGVRQTDE